MRAVEKHNPQLAGVLAKTFGLFISTLLQELPKKISDKPKVGRRPAASPTESKDGKRGTEWNPSLPNRADTVLSMDACHIYRQVDRAHREWTPAQIGVLANLAMFPACRCGWNGGACGGRHPAGHF